MNPSLWRQAQLNGIHGLFEVAPGHLAGARLRHLNITFIAGDDGLDRHRPAHRAPCAKACLDLANEHLGERPVVAVIYTHSHTDHFGGVLGVTTTGRRRRRSLPGHRARALHARDLGENVHRRLRDGPPGVYQFGPLLPPGPRGTSTAASARPSRFWPPGLIAPTEEITRDRPELVVDGVRIVFQITPETEAPAEMNFFFPDHGWLCMAENCTHNMHNLVPIRGAQVRDALNVVEVHRRGDRAVRRPQPS